MKFVVLADDFWCRFSVKRGFLGVRAGVEGFLRDRFEGQFPDGFPVARWGGGGACQ